MYFIANLARLVETIHIVTRIWKRFQTLSWRDRARLLEATAYLAAARLALVLFPFRRLAPRLGAQNLESSATLTASPQADQARQVGWAVTTMSRFVPWDSACLAQAVAAKWMLQKRDLPSTLYLGVAYEDPAKNPKPETNMIAHAWLRCGSIMVTGAPVHKRFTVISSFADEPSTDH